MLSCQQFDPVPNVLVLNGLLKDTTQCQGWFSMIFDSIGPSQQFFSYVGMGIPGLNLY